MYACRVQKTSLFRNSGFHLRLFTKGNVTNNPQQQKDRWIKRFAQASVGGFAQEPPQLENTYLGDEALRSQMRRIFPEQADKSRVLMYISEYLGTLKTANVLAEAKEPDLGKFKVLVDVDKDLTRFGARVATDIYALGRQCELEPPYLKTHDAWGNSTGTVVTCDAWKALKGIAAEEGLISYAYTRPYAAYSRLYQVIKLYLFSPSSGLYNCPLAMTDGAAKTLEVLGLRSHDAFARLTTRDPNRFWTSGQWMTEKKGGSDVAGGTDTVAIEQDAQFRLYGYKWFSSATDSNMSLTLARVINPETGEPTPGTRGLSLFYVNVQPGEHLQLIRLKEKLGTRQLPTGELLLTGLPGTLVGQPGRGVANISPMLTVTRLHNAVASVAAMRRILSLARDYSHRRKAFGQIIGDQALHIRTLALLELKTRGCLALLLEMAKYFYRNSSLPGLLLGAEETNEAQEADKELLRFLTPILKLYTGKLAVQTVSEGLECFGGQGYMEDTGLPCILRDAQVLPIWEGTTSVLSLDVLRALSKHPESLITWSQRVDQALENPGALESSVGFVRQAKEKLLPLFHQEPANIEYNAREIAFSVADVTIGALLIEHAKWDGATECDRLVAQRWARMLLRNPSPDFLDRKAMEDDRKLTFDGYKSSNLLAKYY